MNRDPKTHEEQSPEAHEVATDELPRTLFGGYDRTAIAELLDTMSGRIRALAQERAGRESRLAELEQELERSRENQRLIGETLVSAREEAEAIREEARRSAEQQLQAAREQGRRIVGEAEQAANERVAAMIAAAQEKRDAIVDEGRAERQALLDEAGRARAFVEQTHEQLSDFLLAAVKWYEQAKPSIEDQPSAGEAETSPKDLSSMPSAVTASSTRESEITSSSDGRSAE